MTKAIVDLIQLSTNIIKFPNSIMQNGKPHQMLEDNIPRNQDNIYCKNAPWSKLNDIFLVYHYVTSFSECVANL